MLGTGNDSKDSRNIKRTRKKIEIRRKSPRVWKVFA